MKCMSPSPENMVEDMSYWLIWQQEVYFMKAHAPQLEFLECEESMYEKKST